MTFRTVILSQHGDFKTFIYETPCGILTYSKNRKRHDWVLKTPGGLVHFREDYRKACDEARVTPGSHLILLLDGEPLFKDALV